MPAQCPYCSSYELNRSRLRWWDVAMAAMLVRPLRCRLCERRSYHLITRNLAFEPTRPKTSSKEPLNKSQTV